MRIVDYKVIYSLESSHDKFEEIAERLSKAVLEGIKTGWQPYGPMVCDSETDSRFSRYMQAMVKYEKATHPN